MTAVEFVIPISLDRVKNIIKYTSTRTYVTPYKFRINWKKNDAVNIVASKIHFSGTVKSVRQYQCFKCCSISSVDLVLVTAHANL